MRLLPALLLMTVSTCVLAQTPPPAALEREATRNDRSNQKIEHITVEDAGSRVSELRVGGETQSITVQPKTGGVEYEVQPVGGVRSRTPTQGQGADTGTTNGPRVWNVLKF